jgi:NAD(P)H-hydrate repair Nnr-like enzyme with NAD(P)H-hydrate dehydratase domain
VIARPDGEVALNPTGNPGLATGGTGDVLSGLCAALLAHGWPAWEAALGGAWLHGVAADRLVALGCGPIGLTAGELPEAIRAEINALASRGSGAGMSPD